MWRKLKNIGHLGLALIANLWFGFPSRKIKVIGVTGTDGKTTTTWLIHHLLTTAGKKASFITSIYAQVGGKVYDVGLHVTTPSSFQVQKLISQAVKAGDEYFVLETTSHALDQSRVEGVNFEIGVITNVTREHLDYHKTYENYLATKLSLLQNSNLWVANADDDSFAVIKSLSDKLNRKLYSYGDSEQTNFPISKLKKWGLINLADFNYYNYAASAQVAKIVRISEYQIIKGLKSFTLPKGRLEKVFEKDFTIIIDFAHTPNAIRSALSAIRKNTLKEKGRLIHVFGSAGLRDAQKRAAMGEASASGADISIITEEDFRTESLEKICSEISVGLLKNDFKFVEDKSILIKNKSFLVISDRQEAIDFAVKIAKRDDVIVLTGKGHEKSLCRGKTEYPWSEHEAVKKALSK